jgi:aryl-alcohol dehydrogenase-like predicted oxidoreductase
LAVFLFCYQGKVLYWGTSEWRGWQVSNAVGLARQWGLYLPAVEQPQYNMFYRDIFEVELVDTVEAHGMGTVVWSPLASGILTGKYNDGIPTGSRMSDPNYAWLQEFVTQDKITRVRKLTELAQDLGMTTAQLALVWLLRLPQVSSVITGASRAGQVHENMKALEFKDKLTPDVLDKIEEILMNNPNAEA